MKRNIAVYFHSNFPVLDAASRNNDYPFTVSTKLFALLSPYELQSNAEYRIRCIGCWVADARQVISRDFVVLDETSIHINHA